MIFLKKITDDASKGINIFGVTEWALFLCYFFEGKEIILVDNDDGKQGTIVADGVMCSSPTKLRIDWPAIISTRTNKTQIEIEKQLKGIGVKEIYKISEADILQLMDSAEDSVYLRYYWRRQMGYELDLDNPKTYNEKLQWLKIHDRKTIYKTLVDKYEVKSVVANIIGQKYVIRTYGVYDSFKDIDFRALPDTFVLKCTHNSGGKVLCKNKNNLNLVKIEKDFERMLKKSFYYVYREWCYKDVKPRIIVEELLGDGSLPDYKFFMFYGKCDSVLVCSGRNQNHLQYRFYDTEWKRLNYLIDDLEPEDDVPKPENFEKMLEIAEKLSANYPHIRVDLYNDEGKIFFGELTLYNQAGYDKEINKDTDLWMGTLIRIDEIGNDKNQ